MLEKKKEDRKSDKKCYALMKKKRTNFLYRFVIEKKNNNNISSILIFYIISIKMFQIITRDEMKLTAFVFRHIHTILSQRYPINQTRSNAQCTNYRTHRRSLSPKALFEDSDRALWSSSKRPQRNLITYTLTTRRASSRARNCLT